MMIRGRGRPLRRGRRWGVVLAGATLAALGGLPMLAFGRGPGTRRSRKLGQSRNGENSGVSADERFIEPLGHDIAWGQLEQLDGKYAGIPVMLTRQFILIGRQSDCDIIVDDDRASRYHIILGWDHGHAYLRDNQSTNGTVVNGQPGLGVVPLRNGDIVEVAGTKLRFTYTDATGLAVLEEQPTEKFALPGVALPDMKPHAQARLMVLTGPEAGRSWPVTGGIITIGRGQNNLVSLPHPSVSRVHAQLVVQPTGIYMQDVGSSNGASVNGETLVAPRLLYDGDHIQIGDILLIIKIDAEAPAAPEDLPTQRLPATLPGIPLTAPAPPPYRGAMTRPGVGPRPSPPDAAPAEPPSPGQFRPPQTTHPLPSAGGDRSLPRFRPIPRPEDEVPGSE